MGQLAWAQDIGKNNETDDSLMFLKATENNCRMIVRILDSYCTASGQLVNFEKSNMFFSPNTPLEVKDRLKDNLNVTISEDPGKYLGLPTLWGRSKKTALAFVKDKILGKIQGWKHG